MKSWSNKIKDEVIRLRLDGQSYTELTKSYGVPKSTLHYWLKNIDRPSRIINQSKKNWFNTVQKLGAQANKKKRVERLRSLEAEVNKNVSAFKIDLQTKKIILAVLYWAEGAKGRNDMVNFANTDPQMILLFVRILRESFQLDENKFRVRLHLHYYHNEHEIKKYWSNLLGIPETQFTKTYRKERGTNKTYRKNSSGICFLKYNNIAIKDELLFLAHLLADKLVKKNQ